MSNNTARIFATAMAIAMALILCPIHAAAQTNKAGIDDEVFKIYTEADKQRLTERGLQLSEQAYELAVKKGDKKGQSLTLCLQIFYHYKRGDTNGLKAVVDRIMSVSKHNGQSKYYFFSWLKWIEYNINERNLLLALQEAQKMNHEVLANHSHEHYDVAASYRALANVYWGRYDFDKAATYYHKALDYYKKYMPKQDATIVYLMLVKYYQAKRNYKQALKMVNEAIERSNNPRTLGSLYTNKAIVCFQLEDKKAFADAYNKMKAEERKHGDTDSNSGAVVEVMKYILNGDMNKAAKAIDSVTYDDDRVECKRLLARAQNNGKALYDLSDDAMDLSLEDIAKVHANDMAEINRSMDEIQFKTDNLQLQLQLSQSKSEKEQLEKERILARENMKDLQLANNLLKLNETRTADSLNKSKLAYQAQTLAAQKERVRQEEEAHKLHVTIFVLLLIFLLALLFNEWLNRKKSKDLIIKLSHSNIALEEAKERAEESSRMKSMFVQNVSHEIRTPLNAIVGFTDLLLNPDVELSQEEKSEFGNIIHHNTDLLTGLVNDVLVLSELQSGKAKLNISTFKCNDLCRGVINTVMYRKPKDVTLDFTTDVADDFTITTDQRRVTQVIINFLTNAEKYTTQGSITLDCSSQKKPGSVVFSVTDTGCGIPPEKQEKIFDRFEKLDDFHQGMGLGLNICSYIAQLMDAEIGIDKTYTQGSRFYFIVANNK